MIDILTIFVQSYSIIVMIIIMSYTVRHFYFTFNRTFMKQRLSYEDIHDSESQKISVFVAMHNEEKVAKTVLECLLKSAENNPKIEVIAINDHSIDKTEEILNDFIREHPQIKAIHRKDPLLPRGKPNGLNDALKIASGDIIIVFDADHIPPKGIVENLATAFHDPEVVAVMGRVVPYNAEKNLVTSLITIERSAGYQIDQQARYNLNLMPQYGGTVAGFRKEVIVKMGGFDPRILAEDTDLSIKTYMRGWKIMYNARSECFEEAPEVWRIRSLQIMRWARGHNLIMIQQMKNLLQSRFLSPWQKIDGALLLMIYMLPFLLVLAFCSSLFLLFFGNSKLAIMLQLSTFTTIFHGFGNFAPFFQASCSLMLDGDIKKARLIPLMAVSFFFSMIYCTMGFCKAVADFFTNRTPEWLKTVRFRQQGAS